jgi:hypothetical protein
MSKCVVLIHSWCEGVRAGIQGGHAQTQLVRNAHLLELEGGLSVTQSKQVKDWIDNHVTVAYLKGGVTSDLKRIAKLLKQADFAFTEFREPDFGNAVTAIATIVEDDWDIADNMSGSIKGMNLRRNLWKLFKESPMAR